MEKFNKSLSKIGIITLSIAVVTNFIPALYLWLIHGIVPSFKEIITIWGLAAATFGVSWIVQPIAYFSVLGMSGTYIAWLAGSVADIRLPAVTMAQKSSGSEAGTHEGDVIATLGTSSSVFVSLTIVAVFTVIGSQVLPLLPASITDAFQYLLPALFGAIYMELSKKNIKTGMLAMVFGIILTIFASSMVPGWAMTLLVVISGIIASRIVFQREQK